MSQYNTVEKCHQRSDTKRVLKYVNRLRAELGLKPVKHLAVGSIGSVSECSIANTFNTKYTKAEVNGSSIAVTRFSRLRGNRVGDQIQYKNVDVPQYVQEWIQAFDHGFMPGLKK